MNSRLSKLSPRAVRSAMRERDRVTYYSRPLPDGRRQVIREVIVGGRIVPGVSGPVGAPVAPGSAGMHSIHPLRCVCGCRVSEENLAVVRRFYEVLAVAWASDHGIDDPVFERSSGYLAPDYEFVFARHEGTGLEPGYTGPQGHREGLRGWLENWDEWETTAEEFRDLGDRVLVLSRSRGRSLSGVELDVETAELHRTGGLVDSRRGADSAGRVERQMADGVALYRPMESARKPSQ